MGYEEETYLLDSIGRVMKLEEENNFLLYQLVDVVNMWLAHHHQENEDDFGRNVLANLISNVIEGNVRRK